jgi:hypothetical protein
METPLLDPSDVVYICLFVLRWHGLGRRKDKKGTMFLGSFHQGSFALGVRRDSNKTWKGQWRDDTVDGYASLIWSLGEYGYEELVGLFRPQDENGASAVLGVRRGLDDEETQTKDACEFNEVTSFFHDAVDTMLLTHSPYLFFYVTFRKRWQRHGLGTSELIM